MPKAPNENINIRLPLAADIKTRDGTLTKDPQMWNCFVQHTKKGPVVEKRPGLILSQQLSAGVGQGSFAFYVGGGGNGNGSIVGNPTPSYTSPPLGISGTNSNPSLPDPTQSRIYVIVNDTLIPNVAVPPQLWTATTPVPVNRNGVLVSAGSTLWALQYFTGTIFVSYSSSDNGATWVGPSTTNLGSYALQAGNCGAFYNSKLCLYGFNSGLTRTTLYTSSDGATWTSVGGAEPFANCSPSCLIIHQGDLYLFRFYSASTSGQTLISKTSDLSLFTPVYSYVNSSSLTGLRYAWSLGTNVYSSNGVTVYKSTDNCTSWASVGTLPVTFSEAVSWVYNGEMYIASGLQNSIVTKTIYKSTDGITWTLVNSAPAFTATRGATVAIHNGAIYLSNGKTGALTTTYIQQLYYSTNP